jgi:very-short-patch-repair endonuclease
MQIGTRQAAGMASRPVVPARLRDAPFRGSAAIRAGLLTRAQLAGQTWRRLFADVYAHADVPVDHFTRCEAAALLLPPGAALAGRSAAHLWQAVDRVSGDQPVEVAVPATVSMRQQPGLRLSRTRFDVDDVTRFGAIPVTTPVRTAFDLGRRPDLTEAVVSVDAFLAKRLVKLADLADYAEDRAGWPGTRQVRRVLELAVPGAESPMETRLRLLLVLAGLPTPAVQHRVSGYRLDLAYPEFRLGIEYDGDHHRERGQFQRDLARLNRLRLLGWTVLRFTADDVLRHPERVVEQVRRALRPDLLGH